MSAVVCRGDSAWEGGMQWWRDHVAAGPRFVPASLLLQPLTLLTQRGKMDNIDIFEEKKLWKTFHYNALRMILIILFLGCWINSCLSWKTFWELIDENVVSRFHYSCDFSSRPLPQAPWRADATPTRLFSRGAKCPVHGGVSSCGTR